MKNSASSVTEFHTIGAIFSLTGHLSWLGTCKKKACELKVRMINEGGGINGKKLRVVYYDDRSSAKVAEKLAERLIIKEKVMAIVGTTSVPISLSVARIANKYGVPVLASSGYLIDPYRDRFVFNTAHRTELAILSAFRFFLQQGIENLALFMPEGSLGDVGSYLAKLIAKRLKMRVIAEERFDPTSRDLKACALKTILLSPQAVFSFITGIPAARVAKTFSDLGAKFPLLVSHGNASPYFFRSIEGVKIPVIVPSGKTMIADYLSEEDPSKSHILEFDKLHTKCFGHRANYHSAEIVDSLDLIAEALKCGALNCEEIRDAIEGIKYFVGMQGLYSFSKADHYGTSENDIVVLEIKDGCALVHVLQDKMNSLSRIREGLNDITSGRATGLYTPLLLAPKEERRSKSWDPCEFFSSREYINLKLALSRAITQGDEIKARNYLNEMLILLDGLEELETLRLATFEIFITLSESAKDICGEEELVKMRLEFMKKWTCIREKEEMLVNLLDAFYQVISRVLTPAQRPDILTKLLSSLANRVSESVSLSEIAKDIGLSASYLCHKLKREHGITFKECLIRIRIGKALKLLAFSELPISRIAHEVGFSDQSYFTKVFRKYAKMTPKSFRKDALKNYRSMKNVFGLWF